MTLFDIAYKNIKRNFQNYFLYFTSMVFSIMIYFTFTSIQYNDQVIKLVSSSMKIDNTFKASAVVIAIFSAMFIWYSNSFFTKKRKKEVALYSILGVKKKQIARMLFYENIVMGLMALAVGILIGTLFSKLFVMILINLMGFSIPIKFAIIPKAIMQTTFVFLIIFVITAVHGYVLIYRFKLIDLFKAEKTGQKEPKASPIFAGISIILIGYGYYLSHHITKDYHAIIVLGTTIIGTYILFSSFIVFAIKIAKKNKSRYFKGINMIGTSHLLFRIKGNSRSLATIAVLSASTITAMGAVAALSYDQKTQIGSEAPFSFVYYNLQKDKSLDEKVDEMIGKYPKNKLVSCANVEFIKIKGKEEDVEKNRGEAKNKSTGFNEVEYGIISESNFNEVIKARGISAKVPFNSDKCILFVPFFNKQYMNSYTGKKILLPLKNEEIQLKIADFKDYPLINTLFYRDILVVKDDLYKRLYNEKSVVALRALNVENQKESKELTESLNSIIPKISTEYGQVDGISSYYYSYSMTMTSFGSLLFIGGFLSLVFLICTGSVIFFKQLSEATEDKERYKILKNIGVNKNEIRASIAKQLLIVFGLPLTVGISHSLVALFILKPVMKTNILYPIFITIGVYILIYFGYYVLAVNSYCKIVNGKA